MTLALIAQVQQLVLDMTDCRTSNIASYLRPVEVVTNLGSKNVEKKVVRILSDLFRL